MTKITNFQMYLFFNFLIAIKIKYCFLFKIQAFEAFKLRLQTK